MSLKNFDERKILLKNSILELSYWSESYADIYQLQLGKISIRINIEDKPILKFYNSYEPGIFYVSLHILWFNFSIFLDY
jgi:hypothetical protein